MKTIKEPKQMVCDKCEYIWFTKSELELVTCPNCGSKIKAKEMIK